MNASMKISGLLPTVGLWVGRDVGEVVFVHVFTVVSRQMLVPRLAVSAQVRDTVEGM